MGDESARRPHDPPSGPASPVRAWGRRLLAVTLVGYLVTWAVNRSLVDVRGGSMEPALRPGDRLLTVPAWRGALRSGRLVVVTDPTDPTHLVIKRIAHIVGDAVTVLGDHAAASTDSRDWGPLPTSAVRRLVVRRWPDLRTHLHRTPAHEHTVRHRD